MLQPKRLAFLAGFGARDIRNKQNKKNQDTKLHETENGPVFLNVLIQASGTLIRVWFHGIQKAEHAVKLEFQQAPDGQTDTGYDIPPLQVSLASGSFPFPFPLDLCQSFPPS